MKIPNVEDKGVVIHDKVQLWEGGPYWATTNIGAKKPEDFGCYFWWGDVVGYRRENGMWVASNGNGSGFIFDMDNAPTYQKNFAYLRDNGWINEDNCLMSTNDAAQAHWGGAWRMPTEHELFCLANGCDWTWGSVNGVKGYLVQGRGDYFSNRIFLPAAGYGIGNVLHYDGSDAFYWSSVPFPDDQCRRSWELGFAQVGHDADSGGSRYTGQSIRPVQGFAK